MNPIYYAARFLSGAPVAGDALADPEPEPEPMVREVVSPPPYRLGVEPMYVTAFEMPFRARAADEALVLERLAVETAARGSWEAARTLFAPDGPCAGLYATQTPEPRPSRVSVSPDAHRPAQPLP